MITITGATGLLGSRILFDLANEGHNIRALKRKSSDIEYIKKVFSYYSTDPETLFSRVRWVDFDILDMESLMEALDGTTRLYHAAAYVSFNPADKKTMLTNNVQGTANIVNACLELGIEKLCHISSTSALGKAADGELVTESAIWTPEKLNSAYSISKFRSEMEVWRGMEEGLKAVIINPSIIFGPGFWEKGSSSMFSTIKKGLGYYTKGSTGFVSVGDVSRCARDLMDSNISGERFIISSENLPYKYVFEKIASALNVRPPTKEATPFLADMAWRLDALRSFFTGKRVITREAVHAGQKNTLFSNEKIKNAIGIEFEKIDKVIADISQYYIKGGYL